MGHEEHGALILRKRLDQHLFRGEIQMVGGLVEHEEVWRIIEQLRHHQPRLFAPRQHAAFLLDVVARKTEATRERAQRALTRLREGRLQLLEHAEFAVQHFHGVLGEIAHLHRAAHGHCAGVGTGRANHQFQQGGLARAIDPHHAPALLAAHQKVEPFIDHAVAIALVDVLQRDHILAGAGRWREFEGHGLAALGRLHALDLVEFFHAALDLRRMGGARLEALDELDLLGEHGLLALELRQLLLLVLRALGLIEFIIARIGIERAAVDLHHFGDDAVHEGAIMGGHEQGALVAAQEVFQPDQAFQIQMVARLVEQHAVRAHEQDAGEGHAHLPAARKRAHVAVHHLFGEAQARQHLAGAAFQRIAAQLLEAPLRLAIKLDDLVHIVGLVGVAHGGLQLAQARGDFAHRACAVHHLGGGAAAGHFTDILAEIADGDAPIDAHLTLIRQLLAGDHAEQCGLARAVGADETDLLAPLKGGGGLDEENLMAVLLGNVVEADHERVGPWAKGRGPAPLRHVAPARKGALTAS